jgi:hypothetical protein
VQENWPEAVLGALSATLALAEQARAAIEALPDKPAAARNLFRALMENRACLAALEPTADILAAAYRAGREDERAEQEASRPGRHLRKVS